MKTFGLPAAVAVSFLQAASLLHGQSSDSSTPPGQVAEPSATNAQPVTPAPPSRETKSAPGGNAPSGSNGFTINGRAVTRTSKVSKVSKKSPAQNVAAPGPTTNATANASSPAVSNAPATAPAKPVPPPSPPVLQSYLASLNDSLKLTSDEKNNIQTYYLKDGAELHDVLNNQAKTPLQQEEQVADLRSQRNDKIEALLADDGRVAAFRKVEAFYRVALTEAAAKGDLIPAQPPAPAPEPTKAKPSDATPIPTRNGPTQ